MILLTLLVLIPYSTACWTNRPNIVFIIVDDLGWNDVSFHGSLQIPTPNIDIIGLDGVILNNYYVAPLCTPSRGSLMTGKYPIKLGLQSSVISGLEPWGLPLEEKLLPQYLKELGYVTRGIGKWHLGFFEEAYIPSKRGFDSYFGSWTGYIDYYTHVKTVFNSLIPRNISFSGLDFHDNEDIARGYDGNYTTELYTEIAKHIIKHHNYEEPLFLYLAHHAVHTGNEDLPYRVPSKYSDPFFYINDRQRRTFAGVVSALDISIGEIFLALDEANILNNTILVFTTDNGGAVQGYHEGTGSNYPLRGAKNTLWEGGTRGTAWIWSSEIRKKNRVLNDLMHVSDWLPTLYAAAGGDTATLNNLDGYNQWPTILGLNPSPRQEILYNIDPIDKASAVKRGQYKLIAGSFQNGQFDGWFDGEGKHENESISFEGNRGNLNQNTESSLLYFNALASNVLIKNYQKDLNPKLLAVQSKQLVIDCQINPSCPWENCQPTEAPCLFDVYHDPCEYNNLANKLPQVVEELQSIINFYRKQSIPPRNKPSDPAGNPKYFNNNFVPWRSKR